MYTFAYLLTFSYDFLFQETLLIIFDDSGLVTVQIQRVFCPGLPLSYGRLTDDYGSGR